MRYIFDRIKNDNLRICISLVMGHMDRPLRILMGSRWVVRQWRQTLCPHPKGIPVVTIIVDDHNCLFPQNTSSLLVKFYGLLESVEYSHIILSLSGRHSLPYIMQATYIHKSFCQPQCYSKRYATYDMHYAEFRLDCMIFIDVYGILTPSPL